MTGNHANIVYLYELTNAALNHMKSIKNLKHALPKGYQVFESDKFFIFYMVLVYRCSSIVFES